MFYSSVSWWITKQSRRSHLTSLCQCYNKYVRLSSQNLQNTREKPGESIPGKYHYCSQNAKKKPTVPEKSWVDRSERPGDKDLVKIPSWVLISANSLLLSHVYVCTCCFLVSIQTSASHRRLRSCVGEEFTTTSHVLLSSVAAMTGSSQRLLGPMKYLTKGGWWYIFDKLIRHSNSVFFRSFML